MNFPLPHSGISLSRESAESDPSIQPQIPFCEDGKHHPSLVMQRYCPGPPCNDENGVSAKTAQTNLEPSGTQGKSHPLPEPGWWMFFFDYFSCFRYIQVSYQVRVLTPLLSSIFPYHLIQLSRVGDVEQL